MKSRCFGVIALLILLAGSQAVPKEKILRSSDRLVKTAGTPTWTNFNVNYISTTFSVIGFSDVSRENPWGLAGLIYPKGSGKTAVFAAGPIWGAWADTGEHIRIGGAAFDTGLEPGKILDGMQPEPSDLPKNRIYRVRPDIPPGSWTADVSSELNDGEGSSETIYDQYQKDWNEWPWQDGAPFDDKDQNGTYDPAVDVPGMPGADQSIFGIARDIPSTQMSPFLTPPLGLELQTTAWGYRSEGALGHVLFRRYVLVNRSSVPFDSMYLAMWADPDLGNPGDDLVGCDTNRSLGFVYNGQETDLVYSPLPPPAVGFDFFQGPLVPGAPTDSAIFRGKRIYGKRNLPMTAFFATGWEPDPVMWDPLQVEGSAGALQMYRKLQGLLAETGEPYVDPVTGASTRFPFAGDPQKRTGWLDGTHGLSFGDRRLGTCTGPFTMVSGDTQEVVVAEICAGAIPGCDRLSAIGLLKYYDDQAQAAYDNFFAVPRAPSPPKVEVSTLDQEVILNWGDDSAAVAASEVPTPVGYAFEGYNVYQLPTGSASVTTGKLLATFDVINGVGKIIDEDFNPSQGSVLETVKQYGTDSGVQRWLRITKDRFQGDWPLVNGNPYYFAVTAYNFNPAPEAVPATLESPLIILTVVPHSANPGTRYAGSSGDTITPVVHTTVPSLFPSDGTVLPLIMDPSKLTGHQYSVTFDTTAGIVYWMLTDVTTGAVKLSRQENQSGDQHYLATDGFQTIVSGPLNYGWWDWRIPMGKQHWTSADADYGMEGFDGAMGNGYDSWFSSSTISYEKLRNVRIKFATADGTWNPSASQADPNFSRGYRYLRGASKAPAIPEFGPWIVNPTGGYAYQDYSYSIPFSAWNDETNPPTRLMVGHLENNDSLGRVDGRYWPPISGVGINNVATRGPREWFFIFDVPYSETPDPLLTVDILNNTPPMLWMGTPNRIAGADSNFVAGDEFLILTSHLNVPGNSFSFTAPTNVIGDQALAKDDVNQINVFPNPYYGVNPLEINKYNRFVTFNHLPRRATIRIFNLAGVMVRKISRDNDSQFEQWDLKNDSGLPVGSGLYVIHIEMPDLGTTKVIKLALVQEQQILDRY
ncbi:MAG: hypothetical protein H6Q30_795 [Bacteroidetes bacterium]|nr:hypothetical protein [Bacteroidota bacterium]